MNVSAAPYLSGFRLRIGYSPFFRHVATSALLAALMVKFSSIVAPPFGIEVTSWLFTFLYLYVALARASFVRTHCLASGKPLDAAGILRSETAFSVALRPHMRELAVAAGLCLLAGAVADRLVASLPNRNAVGNVIVSLGMIGWFVWCPRLLVASGAWAIEGHFSLTRGYSLARHAPSRWRNGWLVAVAVNAAVSIGAVVVLYPPLRAMVVAVLPSERAVYLFSAAFFACVIAFQLTLQAAFAAWIAPELLRAEGGPVAAAPPSPAPTPHPTAAPPLSRDALRRLFLLGALLLPAFAFFVMAVATGGALKAAFLALMSGPLGLGLVVWAGVVTLVELPVVAIKTRAAPRAGRYVLAGMRAGAIVPAIGAVVWASLKGSYGLVVAIGLWGEITGLIAGAATGYLYYCLAQRFVLSAPENDPQP